jgi:hypothetical protein
MSIANDLKNVVTELMNQFASTVTVTPKASETIDDWGEPVVVDGVSYSAQAILDVYNEYVRYFTDGRPVGGADVVFIMKTDTVVNSDDTIAYKGVDYRVGVINPIPITDTDIVYLVSAFIK